MTLAQIPYVLVIESDENLAHKLAYDLKKVGYNPVEAHSAIIGLQYSQEYEPALIIVDRLLTGGSGISLCKNIRHHGNTSPILILMSRDEVEDRVACLEAGADDYCLKPYCSEDFLQLVKLYLQPSTNTSEQLCFGNLLLNTNTRRASLNKRTIDLTMKEFELLKYFMEHPHEVLTRGQILEHVWGYDFMGESNVIEVYIRYLRLKIENGGGRRLIQTVRRVGYVLRDS